jgi:hypothetical protein
MGSNDLEQMPRQSKISGITLIAIFIGLGLRFSSYFFYVLNKSSDASFQKVERLDESV